MRIKKILSLAVVLAMVLTVVPMFGLTASAAEAKTVSVYEVFDPDALIEHAKSNNGYSFVGQTTTANPKGDIPWNDDLLKGTNWEGWHGVGQIYASSWDGLEIPNSMFLDIGTENGIIYASDAVKNGTSDKDYMVVNWQSGGDNTWFDIGIVDKNDKLIDTFRYQAMNASGLSHEWAHNGGGGNGFPDDCLDYTFFDNKDAGMGDATALTTYYVVFANSADRSSYSVSYYYKAPEGQATWIGTKAYTSGSADSFGGLNIWMADWAKSKDHPKRFYNVQVHAGSYPGEEVTVNFSHDDKVLGAAKLKATIGNKIIIPDQELEGEDGVVYSFADTIEEAKTTMTVKPYAADGLVAHYTLATDTTDSGINKLNGNNVGSVTFSEDKYAVFDGGTGTGADHITLPADVIKELDGNFSVSMWVNQNDYDTEHGIALWDFANDSNFDRIFWQQGENKDSNAILIQNRGTAQNTYTAKTRGKSDSMKNKWALLTASFDLEKGAVKVFINDQETTMTPEGTWGMDQAPANIYDRKGSGDMEILLGRNAWADSSNDATNNPGFKGNMAEVRIFNKALTAEDVKTIFDANAVKIKYVNADKTEIQDATYATSFSDTVKFEVPTVIISKDGMAYTIKDGDTSQETVQKTDTKRAEIEVEYEPAKLEVTDKVVTGFPDYTVIAGNVPPVETVELSTNNDKVKYVGTLDYENVTELSQPGKHENLSIPVVCANAEGVTAQMNVTVLPCTDDKLAGKINSVGAGKSGVHEFTPIRGNAAFEFDVTYNLNTAGDAGGVGIFIGNNDTDKATGYNGGIPAYSWGGNAIGLQGSEFSNSKYNISFRNGGSSGEAFSINKGEKYRVYITVDTDAHTFTAQMIDSKGNSVFSSNSDTGATEGKYSFRNSDFNILNTLSVVLYNAQLDAETADENAVNVENFRISWTDKDKYNVTTFKYKTVDDEVVKVLKKSVNANDSIKADAYEAKVNAEGKLSASGNYIYKTDGGSEITNAVAGGESTSDVIMEKLTNAAVDGFEKDTVIEVNGEKYKIVSGENLIPNGNFAEGFLGWYDKKGNELKSDTWWDYGNGVLKHTKVENGNGADEAKLYTYWDVKPATTYVLTMKTKNIGDTKYGVINTPGTTQDSDRPKISANHSELTADNFAFDSGEGGRVGVEFRWMQADTELSDFGLFEAIHLERPAAPEATLGWDGESSKFTINYTGEAGQTVKVYHEAETGDGTMSEVSVGSKVLTEDQSTVAVKTENTNRIYTATITKVVEDTAIESLQSAKTSIYKLVVDEIFADGEGTAIDPDKKDAINDVITKGGIYYETGLTDATTEGQKIFESIEVVDNTVTITVNGTAAGYGLGFVLDSEGKICFGSEAKEATYSGEKPEKAADKLTINTQDNTITLLNTSTQEAITLSLDSVNIEFVETLIEELEADGADAAQDFVPEL